MNKRDINMKKASFILLLVSAVLTMLVASCIRDDDKNRADIIFTWSGSEDLLKLTSPLVTWWTVNPSTENGETITNVLWKKDLHYENFDSIMVYAIVTYPMPQQLPDTDGKVFHISRHLSGECLAFDDIGKLISSIPTDGAPETVDVQGEQLESYLRTLAGIIDKKGFVIYRDGHAREMKRGEEFNWIKK